MSEKCVMKCPVCTDEVSRVDVLCVRCNLYAHKDCSVLVNGYNRCKNCNKRNTPPAEPDVTVVRELIEICRKIVPGLKVNFVCNELYMRFVQRLNQAESQLAKAPVQYDPALVEELMERTQKLCGWAYLPQVQELTRVRELIAKLCESKPEPRVLEFEIKEVYKQPAFVHLQMKICDEEFLREFTRRDSVERITDAIAKSLGFEARVVKK